MPYTQADLDNIDAAIAGSELEVQIDGKSIKYRSMDDLMKARAHIDSQLTQAALGASGGRRTSAFRFNFTTYRGD